MSDGVLIVERGGDLLAQQAFMAGRQETIRLERLGSELQSGENRLAVSLTGDNKMPYLLNVGYRTTTPPGNTGCPLRLAVHVPGNHLPGNHVPGSKVRVGETLPLNAQLINATEKNQPMTVAILGLPAGLDVPSAQLDVLKRAGVIDAYEIRAREVILYWRGWRPEKRSSAIWTLSQQFPACTPVRPPRLIFMTTPSNGTGSSR